MKDQLTTDGVRENRRRTRDVELVKCDLGKVPLLLELEEEGFHLQEHREHKVDAPVNIKNTTDIPLGIRENFQRPHFAIAIRVIEVEPEINEQSPTHTRENF